MSLALEIIQKTLAYGVLQESKDRGTCWRGDLPLAEKVVMERRHKEMIEELTTTGDNQEEPQLMVIPWSTKTERLVGEVQKLGNISITVDLNDEELNPYQQIFSCDVLIPIARTLFFQYGVLASKLQFYKCFICCFLICGFKVCNIFVNV